MEIHSLLRSRSTGGKSFLDASYIARTLPIQMQEREINFGEDTDKVFASCWLDDDRVLCGTKCNQLFITDVVRNRITPVETIKEQCPSSTIDDQCDEIGGIHDIDISPSREFLATGGRNASDVAVYRLPAIEPYFIGHGHSNWIFSLAWLDDHFLVSGSRDGTMCLWCTGIIPDFGCEGCKHINAMPADEFGLRCTVPILRKTLPERNHRVRALNYDPNPQTLAALSLSYDPSLLRSLSPPRSQGATLSFWDSNTFRVKRSVKLPYHDENVSLAKHPDVRLYANGSQNHITFLDERDTQITNILAPDHQLNPGVRSLSFYEHILTIGGGRGKIAFYDIRAFKYLERNRFSEQPWSACYLRAGHGYLRQDVNYMENYSGQPPPENAIYTHCYDACHRRLFSAGGPHQAGLFGNYAALWQ
ncbi:DDB1- and CUL4-associated factor 12-like [Corticium candelabrum]|uniref:DDB1- and CUL4-associated factor 12-like n=1 Tax=Corticium candelabrum TaxID=121492 RepID=UPI002E26BB56|nr:DDB1- and CUL4-associated factor 12-like [Corticium candelabrum]